MRNRSLFLLVLVAAVALGFTACSDNEDPMEPELDETPPAAVTDLRVNRATHNSITVNWTSPGDDSLLGRAWKYDLRLSRNPITGGNFTQADQVEGVVDALPSGFTETYAFNGLLSQTTYYMALKTLDEAENLSPISNVVSGTTGEPPDVTPPATVDDLRSDGVTDSSVVLLWTAPGDDGDTGRATGYDIRFLNVPLTEENWAAGDVISPSPIPDPAGTMERWTVEGLEPSTTYFFAMMVVDEAGNFSGVSNNLEVMTSTPGGGGRE